MPEKKKNDAVIAICIQEPTDEGSSMDFGIIKGDDLRFLHQAFITDTISDALEVSVADTRLYYINQSERKRLVKIICDYLTEKLTGRRAEGMRDRFQAIEIPVTPWAERMDAVFRDCFDQGYKHVLLVGSRTPTFTGKMMKTALKMLKESDAVFGPTPEGRYYTIGMSGAVQINLADFDWKSSSIYHAVADAFTDKQLSWSELEIWYAVENAEYLETMARDINQYRFEGDEQTARETEVVMERILTRLEP